MLAIGRSSRELRSQSVSPVTGSRMMAACARTRGVGTRGTARGAGTAAAAGASRPASARNGAGFSEAALDTRGR